MTTELNSPDDGKLYREVDMAEAEIHRIGKGLASVFSARCPGRETPNEDAAAILPGDGDSVVLVVADGMGGGPAGEQASGIAVSAMKRAVTRAARDGDTGRAAILDGFEDANARVQALGAGAGTTMAAVEIQGDCIRPYHVGDSMILVVGQRGKIKLQTISHSPVGYAVEAGVMDENEALHHEARHIVSNVLGSPDMRIELGPTVKLSPRDSVLIASDGLFDNLETEEIVERLRKGPLEEVSRRLSQDSGVRMRESAQGRPSKPDDLTFVAFRLLGKSYSVHK